MRTNRRIELTLTLYYVCMCSEHGTFEVSVESLADRLLVFIVFIV